ncbi:MAG: preprotein translocase subunit YajC [Deltaproteobacteria bacterium]|jgi:preprotein translocase subunit YajC|nr:preprotein translocase subunit YajC [Deltaproteobacteria bacterium]
MLTNLYLSAAVAFAAAPGAGQGGGQGADGAPAGGGGAQLIIFIVGFILIFYFLMLRPQKKQQKERQNMLDSVRKGDRIQTTGGLLCTVTHVDARELTVLIAPEVRVKIARSAIAGVIRQGDKPIDTPAPSESDPLAKS